MINYLNLGSPSDKKDITDEIQPYYIRRNNLLVGHPGMEKAKSIARSYIYWPKIDSDIEESMLVHGIPKTIVIDDGTQFTTHTFQDFCELNGIQHFRTAPYHPQSNGQVEIFVDIFKRGMMKINKGEDLEETLNTFLMTYRKSATQHQTGISLINNMERGGKMAVVGSSSVLVCGKFLGKEEVEEDKEKGVGRGGDRR
ncbi:integrase domain containing protein [Lasius niger]|uniref:Integrase domain containing protein n=1 Tax=Lasius niger TaxID=67767 RepID=A0A0J7NL75_LASNI|nr:integrase domain containing protein [Lasius niger]